MIIKLFDCNERLFTNVNSFEKANVAAKAIFKLQKYSDLYYYLKFDNGDEWQGVIDLEPESFHKPHQNKIVSNHLKTFWGNVIRKSNPKPPFGWSFEEVQLIQKLLPLVKD